VIITKARTMRIEANLLVDLWLEIVKATSYKQAISSITLENLVRINLFKVAKDFSITSNML